MKYLAFFLIIFPLSAFAEEQKLEKATFAGGCFWCLEAAMDKVEGVKKTTSGYNGGKEKDPKYKEVSSGTTGHYETVQVEYDPKVLSYETLLAAFWKNVDPLDARGQFCDKGPQYRSAIFYSNESQKLAAEKSLKQLEATKFTKGQIKTEILPMDTFYPAEDYHQDYYLKNPLRYKSYYYGCGRARRLGEIWK